MNTKIKTMKDSKKETQMTKQEYIAEKNAAAISEAASIINRAMHEPYITLTDVTKAEMEYIHDAFNVMNDRIANLEAEIAQLKKEKLDFNAQCFHKDETISVLKNRITELEFDNCSLVEQMNKMALKPNQAVIEYFYPKYNPITKRLENLPTKECLCIVELYSGEYEIVWWISAGFEETGWDGYCVDEVKSWAYLPKGVTNE